MLSRRFQLGFGYLRVAVSLLVVLLRDGVVRQEIFRAGESLLFYLGIHSSFVIIRDSARKIVALKQSEQLAFLHMVRRADLHLDNSAPGGRINMNYVGGVGFDVRRQFEIVRDGGRIHGDGLNSLGVSCYVFSCRSEQRGLAGLSSATLACSEPLRELPHPPATITKTMPSIKTADFIS